jgi:phosphoglycolate phosphatase
MHVANAFHGTSGFTCGNSRRQIVKPRLQQRGSSTTVRRMRALVAFDLDGVIYSSEPFLGEAYREAIANVNARRPGSFPRVPSTREILDHVGWPVPVILERLFPNIDPAAVELLYAETLTVVCAHVARCEGILFPGVAETLARLHTSGFLLAIASNGRRQYVETVLTANNIAGFFTHLITVDRDGAVREKPDILRAYLARHRVAPRQLIMVGDRSSDVEAAAAVGCAFIGCDYGHGHRDEIAGAGPVVSRFDQLPEAIAALPAAAPPLPKDDAAG